MDDRPEDRGGWSELRYHRYWMPGPDFERAARKCERQYLQREAEKEKKRKRLLKKKLRLLIKRARTYRYRPPRPPKIRLRGERGGDFCIKGHERTPENTYIRKGGALAGTRQCRTCRNLEKNRWYAGRVAKVKAQKQAELAARRAMLARPPMRGVSE